MSSPQERTYMPPVDPNLPAGERPMIAMLHALPGREQQLQSAIAALTAAVRQEPGCKEFRAFHDATNPGTFYLYEIYDDNNAFAQHLTLDHVAHFFTELAEHSTADARALTQLIEIPVA